MAALEAGVAMRTFRLLLGPTLSLDFVEKKSGFPAPSNMTCQVFVGGQYPGGLSTPFSYRISL
jgi:hypothetical protein